jgi:CHASE2 domain-containing sensor protein
MQFLKRLFSFPKQLRKFFYPLIFLWSQYHPKKMWSLFLSCCYLRFRRNLFFGLGITLLIAVLDQYPLVKNFENIKMDWIMQLRQKLIPPIKDKAIPSLIWLDIDNDTYQAWGNPLFIPRDRLKNLIEIVVAAKAKLIIVDVDLSRKTPLDGLRTYLPQQLTQHPYDQALYNYLAQYGDSCEKNQSICPLIILTRYIITNEDKRWIYSSFLDEAVKKSIPYVQWASPLFFHSSDHVLRHWWLWQSACFNKQPTIIPSVELVAATLLQQGCITPRQAYETLNQNLLPFQPKQCGESFSKMPLISNAKLNFCGLSIQTKDKGFNQRIIYSLPWGENPNQPPRLTYFLQDQANQIVMSIFSAQRFAASPNPEALKGNIVVIGGSYAEGRDIYLTPLGDMPGALILINAIHSLLQYGELTALPLWSKLLIQMGFIILMSLAFTFFNSFGGMILSGGIIVFGLLPISIALFHYGIWINFALPLLSVQLFHMAFDFEQFRKKYTQKLV